MGNIKWLKLAFDTLVDNAVRAMNESDKKELVVTTRPKDNRVEIAISDTGQGIPEEVKSEILRAVIKKGPGKGIGLLLAQMILQVYKGNIYVEHTSPEGTTMVAWLPSETYWL